MIILNENEELDSILEDMYFEGYYQAMEEMESPITNYKAKKMAEAKASDRRMLNSFRPKDVDIKGRTKSKMIKGAIGGAIGGAALGHLTGASKGKLALIGAGLGAATNAVHKGTGEAISAYRDSRKRKKEQAEFDRNVK